MNLRPVGVKRWHMGTCQGDTAHICLNEIYGFIQQAIDKFYWIKNIRGPQVEASSYPCPPHPYSPPVNMYALDFRRNQRLKPVSSQDICILSYCETPSSRISGPLSTRCHFVAHLLLGGKAVISISHGVTLASTPTVIVALVCGRPG
jgi:hypothetical protein